MAGKGVCTGRGGGRGRGRGRGMSRGRTPEVQETPQVKVVKDVDQQPQVPAQAAAEGFWAFKATGPDVPTHRIMEALGDGYTFVERMLNVSTVVVKGRGQPRIPRSVLNMHESKAGACDYYADAFDIADGRDVRPVTDVLMVHLVWKDEWRCKSGHHRMTPRQAMNVLEEIGFDVTQAVRLFGLACGTGKIWEQGPPMYTRTGMFYVQMKSTETALAWLGRWDACYLQSIQGWVHIHQLCKDSFISRGVRTPAGTFDLEPERSRCWPVKPDADAVAQQVPVGKRAVGYGYPVPASDVNTSVTGTSAAAPTGTPPAPSRQGSTVDMEPDVERMLALLSTEAMASRGKMKSKTMMKRRAPVAERGSTNAPPTTTGERSSNNAVASVASRDESAAGVEVMLRGSMFGWDGTTGTPPTRPTRGADDVRTDSEGCCRKKESAPAAATTPAATDAPRDDSAAHEASEDDSYRSWGAMGPEDAALSPGALRHRPPTAAPRRVRSPVVQRRHRHDAPMHSPRGEDFLSCPPHLYAAEAADVFGLPPYPYVGHEAFAPWFAWPHVPMAFDPMMPPPAVEPWCLPPLQDPQQTTIATQTDAAAEGAGEGSSNRDTPPLLEPTDASRSTASPPAMCSTGCDDRLWRSLPSERLSLPPVMERAFRSMELPPAVGSGSVLVTPREADEGNAEDSSNSNSNSHATPRCDEGESIADYESDDDDVDDLLAVFGSHDALAKYRAAIAEGHGYCQSNPDDAAGDVGARGAAVPAARTLPADADLWDDVPPRYLSATFSTGVPVAIAPPLVASDALPPPPALIRMTQSLSQSRSRSLYSCANTGSGSLTQSAHL